MKPITLESTSTHEKYNKYYTTIAKDNNNSRLFLIFGTITIFYLLINLWYTFNPSKLLLDSSPYRNVTSEVLYPTIFGISLLARKAILILFGVSKKAYNQIIGTTSEKSTTFFHEHHFEINRINDYHYFLSKHSYSSIQKVIETEKNLVIILDYNYSFLGLEKADIIDSDINSLLTLIKQNVSSSKLELLK